jgi:hypothetical protein
MSCEWRMIVGEQRQPIAIRTLRCSVPFDHRGKRRIRAASLINAQIGSRVQQEQQLPERQNANLNDLQGLLPQ